MNERPYDQAADDDETSSSADAETETEQTDEQKDAGAAPAGERLETAGDRDVDDGGRDHTDEQ